MQTGGGIHKGATEPNEIKRVKRVQVQCALVARDQAMVDFARRDTSNFFKRDFAVWASLSNTIFMFLKINLKQEETRPLTVKK